MSSSGDFIRNGNAKFIIEEKNINILYVTVYKANVS